MYFKLVVFQFFFSAYFTVWLVCLDDYEFVNSCPTKSDDLQKASERMKCSNKVTSGNLFYHCVIHSSGERLVEVCAESQRIIGFFCAEFNQYAFKIQGHISLSCRNHTNPCPYIYNSTDAYIYEECYKAVGKNHTSTFRTSTIHGYQTTQMSNVGKNTVYPTPENTDVSLVLAIALPSISYIIIAGAVVFLYFLWDKYRQGKHAQSQRRYHVKYVVEETNKLHATERLICTPSDTHAEDNRPQNM